jgi:ribosome maturation factor RimP
MIDKAKIEELVTGKLDDDMFLVDISVSATNVIHVEIDSYTGLSIDQCVTVSRHIESNLDRESDDFELQVSSPGAGQLFKVKEQYKKNTGRELEVTLADTTVLKGLLTEATGEGIILETTTKEVPEGTKKKVLVTKSTPVAYSDISKARVIISFK